MTKKKGEKPKQTRLPRLVVAGGVVMLILLLGSGGLVAYVNSQNNRILRGVHVGSVDLGGLSETEADAKLQQAVGSILDDGLTFTTEGKSVVIDSTVSSQAGVDTAYPLYTIDAGATAKQALGIGHERNLAARVSSIFAALLIGRSVPTVVDLDESKLRVILVEKFGKLSHPAVDAHFALAGSDTATVVPEQTGQDFPYDRIIAAAAKRLETLSNKSVTFTLEPDAPKVSQALAATLLPTANAMLRVAPLTLTFEDNRWTITDKDFIGSLMVVKDASGVRLRVDEGKMSKLFDEVATKVDQPAKEAKFNIKAGRVSEFQAAADGRAFDRDGTVLAIAAALAVKNSTIPLAVKKLSASSTAAAATNLGITELVAVGKTNFSGSPTNRRKNIANGARLLNGILIKPGETFSLLKALAPFELSNGYLPELVIKGDRTIPEIGGGLCQIGTTMFRLTLNAGLPILERQNHSYRVRYYEPPVGMDATIYDPKPDFRFTNDYASHLLLQTRIEGDNLIFEFYGTKDGRLAATTTPRTFNVVAPGPKKIIETTDLKPGETKCIEKPHPGSDAEFTYTVTLSNGEKRSQVFKSHYVPWREVCLVGVDPKKLKPKTEEDVIPSDSGAIGAPPTNTNTSQSRGNSNTATNTNTTETNTALTNTNSAPTNTNSIPTNVNASTNSNGSVY